MITIGWAERCEALKKRWEKMKTHIEINAGNLIHNLSRFRELTSGKKMMLVVKGNAYGHGLKEIVSITRNLDFIHYYAVDSVEEALIVKETDDTKKILVIGWTDEEGLNRLIRLGIEMVVPSPDYLKQAAAAAKSCGIKAKVHLKVETGTARMGMSPEEAETLIKNCLTHRKPDYPELEIVGFYSHFANIEDTTDHSYAQTQLEIFTDLIKRLGPLSNGLLKHFSCSASALLFPKTHFDIVRIGISAYGFWPSKPTYVSYLEQKKPALELKPVLSWYAAAAQVKNLEAGAGIGYGLTYRTFSPSRFIVVPVGYYDGYDRKLSGSAVIIVNGVKAPVRGRVCMNMFMAEVTHIPGVKAGDRVTLIGASGKEVVSADHLGEWAGTINYEIISRINPLIPRVVV